MSVLSRLVKVLKAYHNAQFKRERWKDVDLATLVREFEAYYEQARRKTYEAYQAYQNASRSHRATGSHFTFSESEAFSQQSNRHSSGARREREWQSEAWNQWQATSGTAAGIDPKIAGYYANLEIPYGSDLETVRRAWRKLVAMYHPDKFAGDPEKQRIATELTKGINRAYEELTKHLSKK